MSFVRDGLAHRELRTCVKLEFGETTRRRTRLDEWLFGEDATVHDVVATQRRALDKAFAELSTSELRARSLGELTARSGRAISSRRAGPGPLTDRSAGSRRLTSTFRAINTA